MPTKRNVNVKDLTIEIYRGRINIHLDRLVEATKNNNKEEMEFQILQLKKCHSALEKLGWWKR